MNFRPFAVLLVFFAVAMPAEIFLMVLTMHFIWTRPRETSESVFSTVEPSVPAKTSPLEHQSTPVPVPELELS